MFVKHLPNLIVNRWRNCDPAVNRHDYHLVTWSKDSTMKLWPISGNLKTMCGEDEANLHDQVCQRFDVVTLQTALKNGRL